MWDKIKKLFEFMGRAWTGGIRGKLGIFTAFFALFMFVRIFFGEVSIQKFVINIWRLNDEQQQLAVEQKKLDTLKHHIELIQNYSPDYIQELGLKYLNLGSPGSKVLRV
ncbi:MAG TPA: hypothetical protein PLZ05_03790, partial [Alphaproteobacteria bacterium]|nr:hypothetical protein [Alphaproteobacteria bacterium]